MYLHRSGIMLCYPAEEKRILKLPELFIAQPKLNGERCRVEWFDGEPILLSSYGNQFKGLDHITRLLKEFFPPDICWDGELYVHGWSRERIHSAVSRKVNANPDAAAIQFHIFDYQEFEGATTAQITRCAKLYELFSWADADPVYPYIQLVKTTRSSRSEWLDDCAEYISQGYEGIILRHPYAIYQDKRSPNILKYKPTETDEYTITGFNQEIDIHGAFKDSLGSFIVTGDDGTKFSVGTGPALTREKREHYWRYRNSLLGQTLVVKHEKMTTTNNIPIATVAVRVKDWRN